MIPITNIAQANNRFSFLFRSYVRIISIVISLFILPLSSKGQSTLFENYSTREGLPSAEVYDLHQDSYNRLWLCTDRGVCYYDGINFKTLTLGSSLFQKSSLQFFPQSNGELWFCTVDELYIIDPENLSVQAYEFNNLLIDYTQGLSIEDFHKDNKGDIYLSFRNRAEILHINESGEVLETPNIKISNLLFNVIRKFDDGDELIYISNEQCSPVNNDFTCSVPISPGESAYFKAASSYNKKLILNWSHCSIIENNKVKFKINNGYRPLRGGFFEDGRFWIGYLGGGLIIYNQFGEEVAHHLTGLSVTELFIDYESNIWISTLSNGIYRLSNLEVQLFTFEETNHITNLSKSINGDLYGVTLDGRILHWSDQEFIQLMRTLQLTHIEAYGNTTIVAINHKLIVAKKIVYEGKTDLFEFNSRKISENNKNTAFFLII